MYTVQEIQFLTFTQKKKEIIGWKFILSFIFDLQWYDLSFRCSKLTVGLFICRRAPQMKINFISYLEYTDANTFFCIYIQIRINI